MKGVRIIAAALGITGALVSPSQAEPICGWDADRQFDAVRIYSKSFTASCKPGAECLVGTHKMDSSAPLGFSHTFSLQRAKVTETWQVKLAALTTAANTQSGFSLKVDKNQAMVFTRDHIKPGASTTDYMIVPALTDLVLAEAKPGNTIVWSYTSSSGEQTNAAFSLIGLTDALEWASCAQSQLASGKSDPIPLQDAEPVYSSPDPSVPVDPVGDGQD